MVEGASLSTPVDEAFHNIDEGLTVEGWFWLDELPEVGEVQTFFANPAKYALGVGIAEASRADEWYDPDEVRAFGSMWSEEGWGTTPKGIMGDSDHRNPVVGEWFHVAWQFHPEPPDVAWWYAGKQAFPIGLGMDNLFPWTLPAGDGALYVATPYAGQHGFAVKADTDISIFRGLVDEVRVSSIARYEGRDADRPRELTSDPHTIALWTFDGARPFSDKSGNGRHLIAEGAAVIEPLAVDARSKAPITWGALKGR